MVKPVKGVVLKKYKLTQDWPNYLLNPQVLNLIPSPLMLNVRHNILYCPTLPALQEKQISPKFIR